MPQRGRIGLQSEVPVFGRDEARVAFGEVVFHLHQPAHELLPAAQGEDFPRAPDADVTRDDVALGLARLVVENVGERGVALAVRRAIVMNGLQSVEERVAVGIGLAEAPGVEMDRSAAECEDVVFDGVVPSPAQHHGPVDPRKDVAEDGRPARLVVEVDAHDAREFVTALEGRHEVVKVVVADDAAALGPVAPDVERAGVAGVGADVMDLVELQDVVVAPEQDGGVRGVVHQVVRHAVAHAVEKDRGPVSADPAAEMVDVVIDGEVAPGLERLAVAAAEEDAALAGVIDLAGQDAVVASGVAAEGRVVVDTAFDVLDDAADGHADCAEVPQRAPGDEVVPAADDLDAAAAAAFQDKATERDVLGAAQRDQRRLEQ